MIGGNALIEPDMFSDKLVPPSDDVWATVNPFDWRTEFPEVFDAGGFDAVIGNPPWLMAGYYVDDDALEYLRSRFASASGKFDMYYVFIERALELIRPNGIVGMIVPNKMFHTRAARELRRILTAGSWLVDVMDFGTARVFESATNYSAIIQLSRNATAPVHVSRADANLRITEQFDIGRSALDENPWYFHPRLITKLFSTMEAGGTPLEELTDRFGTGVQTGADTILTFDVAEARSEGFEPDLLTPILRGRDVRRYSLTDSPRLLVFPYVEEDEWAVMPESVFKLHPVTYQFLVNHKQHLAERTWFGKTASELSGHWYGLMYLDAPSSFRSPHLLTPSLSARSNFALGTGALFATGTAGVTSIIPKEDVREDIYYLLALLNSRLLSYYLIQHSPVYQGGYHKFSAPYLKAAPIRRIDFTSVADKRQHDRLVSLAKTLIDLYSRLGGAKTPQAHVTTRRQIAACEGETDRLVYGLYGVNEHGLQTIEGFGRPEYR